MRAHKNSYYTFLMNAVDIFFFAEKREKNRSSFEAVAEEV